MVLGLPQSEIFLSDPEGQGTPKRAAIIFLCVILEVTAHHSCCILCIRSESIIQPILKAEGYIYWGSLQPSQRDLPHVAYIICIQIPSSPVSCLARFAFTLNSSQIKLFFSSCNASCFLLPPDLLFT